MLVVAAVAQDVGAVVGNAVPRRPVATVVLGELDLIELRELVQDLLVELPGHAHGVGVARAAGLHGALGAAADGLEVPVRRDVEGDAGGLVAALGLDLGAAAARAERVVDVHEAVHLDELLGLRARRHDGAGHLRLPEAEAVAVRPALHERVVRGHGVGPLAGVLVELRELLEHRVGVLFVRRVALERREGVAHVERARGGAEDRAVHRHELHARVAEERGDARRVRVRAAVLDDLVELVERPLEVLQVVENPGHLVEGVAVDLVVLVLHREHALVELPGVLHLALLEEVFGEGEVRVRHERRLREPLDQRAVDGARVVEVVAVLVREREIEQRPVHLLVVRVLVDQVPERRDELVTVLPRRVAVLRLLSRDAGDERVVVGLARREEVILEVLGAAVLHRRELLIVLGEAHQGVGAVRVRRAHAPHERRRELRLLKEELRAAVLDVAPPHEHVAVEPLARRAVLVGVRVRLALVGAGRRGRGRVAVGPVALRAGGTLQGPRAGLRGDAHVGRHRRYGGDLRRRRRCRWRGGRISPGLGRSQRPDERARRREDYRNASMPHANHTRLRLRFC